MATATTNLSLVLPEATDETVIRTDYVTNLETIDAIFDTVTLTEFGYLDGVTSAIQTQLNAKQALDAGLTSLSALTYVSDSFIKITATDTYAVRTIAQVKSDLSLNAVENTALSTWAGTTNITTLGTVTTGTLSTGAVIAGVTMTLGSDADGDVYYRSSNVLTRLGKGTEGHYLKQGASVPEWAAGAGGYTNLTSFIAQTAWRIFYSDGSGDVTELAFGASGTYLGSNGTTSAPTFSTPAGSGDVVKVGTPANSQVGVWTGDGTIEGAATLTYDGTNLLVTGSIGATATRITKGWFANLEITNTPTVNGTSLASIYAAIAQTFYIGTTQVAINRTSAALTLAGITLTTPDIGTPAAGTLTNCDGTASSLTAGAVTNATLTTALTVNTGTLTLTANSGNSSVLTIGAGAVSVSGSNTGDQTNISGNAATVTVDATTTDTSCFVAIFESASGSLEPQTDATLTYQAATGILTATGFVGDVTGDCTGSSGSCTGQAATVATITTLAPDTATTAATQTAITSLKNAALVIGRDADNDIDFASDNKIIFRFNGADRIEMLSTGELDMNAGSIGFTQQTVSYNGTTTTVDWKLGNKAIMTFGAGNITTFAFTNPTNPCNLVLKIVQDGTGSRTVTNWDTDIKFPGGTDPTLSTALNSVDIISFYWDGTNYHGVISKAFAVPA